MEYKRTVDRNPWIPELPHPKQRQLLLLSDIREVFYGGAARGGKTKAALMAAAQYVDVPGYSALLLRSTFPDLHQPDGLIPASKEWWAGTAATWSEKHCRWTFPGGAMVSFGHLDRDDDVYQYQGSRHQLVDIDELTQHTEFRYRYLFSRLDRPAEGPLSQVPLRMRSQSNPGGKGHEWVKKRFIDPRTRLRGAVFVPARVEDNPSVDLAAYLESLSYLDPITRAQLLAGDWDAVHGGRFRREWFRRWRRHPVEGYNLLPVERGGAEKHFPKLALIFQTVDPAASAKTTADYTVIATWGLTQDSQLLWLDCERHQVAIPDIPPLVEAAYKRWKPAFVAIEAVAGNNAVYAYCSRSRMVVQGVSPMGLDKLVRATPAMILAQSGRIYFPVAAPWLEEIEAELLMFTGDDKQDAHDDVVDCVSYACEVLQGRIDEGGAFSPRVHKGK